MSEEIPDARVTLRGGELGVDTIDDAQEPISIDRAE